MAASDLAISAGGGTCDELAFPRVPMFLITIAKNQEQAVEAYRRERRLRWRPDGFTVLDKASLARSLRQMIGDRDLRIEIAENAGTLAGRTRRATSG